MKAFTFIETMVAIAVFTVILGAATGMIVMAYRDYGYIWQRSLAIGEARRGIEVMVKEIREARMGDDGSYPIMEAENNEFIFFSDIDKDGEVERVRYFLSGVSSGNQIQECVTFDDGGSCQTVFSSFLSGELKSASIIVSVEGDFGWNNQEYAEISVDGAYFGRVCNTGCSDCAGNWEGTTTYDVTEQARDGSIVFIANANWRVDNVCDWQEPNHSMKVSFELSWQEEIADAGGEFKKGIIDPQGAPAEYLLDQEKISILSAFVRNSPPIFEYFDAQGNMIEEYPARLTDTKVMRVFLIVDVDPEHSPNPFELESAVHLRNLKQDSQE